MANAEKTNLIVWFLNKATGSPEREDNRKLEAYATRGKLNGTYLSDAVAGPADALARTKRKPSSHSPALLVVQAH